jgi:hypothetical protein
MLKRAAFRLLAFKGTLHVETRGMFLLKGALDRGARRPLLLECVLKGHTLLLMAASCNGELAGCFISLRLCRREHVDLFLRGRGRTGEGGYARET